MPYDSTNKTLYVDKSVTPNKGISLSEIATCIKDFRRDKNGNYDLGMLCTSPNIKIYSKNKPFVVADGTNLRGVQTEEARRLAAYGFHWWNRGRDSQAPFGTSATECLNKAIANEGKWPYNRPTEIFRVQDFDGYKHNAEKPYRFDINSADLGQTNYLLPVLDPGNTNIQIKLTDMPDFEADYSGSMEDLNIVVIYRLSGSTGSARVKFSGQTVGDLDGGTFTETIDLAFGSLNGAIKREYDVCFAATNATSEDDTDDVFYLYLPEGLGKITQKEGFTWTWEVFDNWGEDYYGIVANDSGHVVLSGENDEASFIVFSMAFLNQFPYDLDWRMQVLAWNPDTETIDDAYTIKMLDSTEWGIILKNGGRVYLWDAGNGIEASLQDLTDTRLGKVKIAVNLQYKYTVNTGWVSRHLNLLNNTLGQYEATDGITLYELATQLPNYGVPNP